jgi:hypothetical protein
MNHRLLLEKLIQIEQAIGVETNVAIHKMLLEAEDCLLQLEKEMVEHLLRIERSPVLDRPILSEHQVEPNRFALATDSKLTSLKSWFRKSA